MANQYKYSLVNDFGKIISRPAAMNGNRGPYYPTLINTSDITGWQAPYALACYFSTDHANTERPDGGIWLYLCNGDPTVESNWVSYDDAVAAGHFDYLTSKPSSNPIYDASMTDAIGAQMETPHVRVINGVVYMSTHNGDGPYGQTTSMNKSADGLNFLWIDYVAVIDNRIYMGDSHTGYAKWDINVLPDVNFTYIGYTTAGGTDTSYIGMWGFNDPEERWTLISQYKRDSGRIFEGVADAPNDPQLIFRLNPSLFIPQDDGSVVAIATTKPQGTSGSVLAIEKSAQFQLYNNGLTPISKVDYFLTPLAESVNYQELTDKFEWNGRKFMLYRGVGSGSSSTAVAHVGLVEYELVDGSLELLDPTVPEYLNIDFTQLSSLPSELTQMTGEASYAFIADGLRINIPAGKSDGFYFQDISSALKMADLSWVNMRQSNGDREWTPRIGFAKDYVKGSVLTVADRVESALRPEASRMAVYSTVNGVTSEDKTYLYDALGNGTNAYTSRKNTYGCRWLPQEDRAGLTTSMIERGFVGTGAMPDGQYTPYLEIENRSSTQSLTIIIEGISFGQAGNIDYTWSLDSKPSASTLTIEDATAKNFDAELDANGTYVFGLVANDESNSSAKVSRTIVLGSENARPTSPVISGSTSAQVNTELDIVAAATDDGGAANLVYEVTVTPASISYIQDGDTVTVSTGSYVGNIELTFRAFDGELYSDPATYTIAVSNNAQSSIGRITILDVTDGLQPIKIFSEATDAKIYEGSPRFTNGVAFVTLPVAVGVSWFGRWLGTNPPQTGTGIFGVSE